MYKKNIKTDSGWGKAKKKGSRVKKTQYCATSLLNQIKWCKKNTHTQKHFLPSEFLLELYAITSVCDCGILN